MQWCGLKCLYISKVRYFLLSPLMQWCGLKSSPSKSFTVSILSPLMQWCGLKSTTPSTAPITPQSPLMQWCGLKFCSQILILDNVLVTTDAVVWIEIGGRGRDYSAGRRHH